MKEYTRSYICKNCGKTTYPFSTGECEYCLKPALSFEDQLRDFEMGD